MFGQALATKARPDRQVLADLAAALGEDLGLPDLKAVHAEANELMDWDGTRAEMTPVAASIMRAPQPNQVVVATHKPLLDDGLLQANAPHLAGTTRRPVMRVSANTAAHFGLQNGVMATVRTVRGSISLPIIVSDIADQVVWLPQCSQGSHVYESLGVGHGATVEIAANQEVAK